MRFEAFSFGTIRIDGVAWERDVVIDSGKVRKRKKKPSKTIPRQLRPHPALNRGGDPPGNAAGSSSAWAPANYPS